MCIYIPYKIRRKRSFLYSKLPYRLIAKLPPIYLSSDTSVDAWRKRRAEIYDLFATEVFGKFPEGSRDGFTFKVTKKEQRSGYTFTEVVATKEDFSCPFHIYLPDLVEKPFIIVHALLECYRNEYNPEDPSDYHIEPDITSIPTSYILSKGVGVVHYQVGDVVHDTLGSENTGLLKTLIKERKADSPKAIGAWAFFASVIADYLFANGIATAGKLGIAGHSRGGKTALWAGASDERFSVVCSSNAGCTGDSLARLTYGEKIKDINRRFPYWFCDNYNKYNKNVNAMPFDFHELLALIAPRYLYVTSSWADAWACPKNQYLALEAAQIVWQKTYNLSGLICDNRPKMGVSYHSGHLAHHIKDGRHSFALQDWAKLLEFIKVKNLI